MLGNTPITYPIEWASSKIPGYAIRLTMPNFHGLTAFMVTSSVAARFFGPQVAGIGATPGAVSVFRIDHDEALQCNRAPAIPAVARSSRGSASTGVMTAVWWPVRCPAPEANCANGPNGTDSIVDVSGLTPDQQFEGGLYCGTVHATPTTPISPTGLCPANMYGSTLVSIPAAGTENDDHNPPRIASAQSLRHCRGTRQHLPRRQVQVERARDGGQSDEQRSALQLPFHVQRNALCFAAGHNRDDRVPLLSPLTAKNSSLAAKPTPLVGFS